MDASRQCKRCNTKHTFAVPPEPAIHAIEPVVEARRLVAKQEFPHSAIVALDTGIYGGHSLQRRAIVCNMALQENSSLLGHSPVQPNPSLKRSANGRPPAPGRWYAVHFHRPGAGVLPLSPA